MNSGTIVVIGFLVFILYCLVRKESWDHLRRIHGRNREMGEGDWEGLALQAFHARNAPNMSIVVKFFLFIFVINFILAIFGALPHY